MMATLSKLSHKRIKENFDYWRVDNEYAEPMINYLVYGFNPGSFFTAVLANDYANAIISSHCSNTIPALQNLSRWMINCMPREAWGDYDKINQWTNVGEEHRRQVLEKAGLIFTPEEETWKFISE